MAEQRRLWSLQIDYLYVPSHQGLTSLPVPEELCRQGSHSRRSRQRCCEEHLEKHRIIASAPDTEQAVRIYSGGRPQ